MEAAGTPIAVPPSPPTFSLDDIRSSVIKEFGAFYLYSQIAKKTGLAGILANVFQDRWQQIFDLACYLISTGEPMMYCEEWIEKTDSYPASLSSSGISRLLQSITCQEQEQFFAKWSEFRREQEYLALDITSVSSYSQLIDEVEWGYNRDGENLPQVNLCLLLGESSHLPIFQTLYNGSIKDVSTLSSTLSLAFSIGREQMSLVMDKGFSSIDNINAMLDGPLKSRFVISLPFTMKFTKAQVLSQQGSIDVLDNTIVLGRDILRGITKECVWDSKKGHKVYAHIYCNVTKAAEARNSLYGYVTNLAEMAASDPKNKKHAGEFKKYLIVEESKEVGAGYTVSIRRDVIDKQLAHTGWLVLISNHITNAKDALRIYRVKDVVEKGFLRLKRQLDLHRLRIHSDTAMRSKVFIGFVSLILMSHIHNVMLSKDFYKSLTMLELIRQLEKVKVQYISGNRILYPLTSTQKMILQAFDIDLPV
jgi:transposase